MQGSRIYTYLFIIMPILKLNIYMNLITIIYIIDKKIYSNIYKYNYCDYKYLNYYVDLLLNDIKDLHKVDVLKFEVFYYNTNEIENINNDDNDIENENYETDSNL